MQEQILNNAARLCCEIMLLWLLWQHWTLWERLADKGNAQDGCQHRRVWQRHPASPRDCPACCAGHGPCENHRAGEAVAWASLKSRRGWPKTVACAYYGITDSQVHALVSHGQHHGADTIPYFKCQACGHKVSARANTVLYRLKTPAARVAEVTTALGEGVDVAVGSRSFGHDEWTIQR